MTDWKAIREEYVTGELSMRALEEGIVLPTRGLHEIGVSHAIMLHSLLGIAAFPTPFLQHISATLPMLYTSGTLSRGSSGLIITFSSPCSSA